MRLLLLLLKSSWRVVVIAGAAGVVSGAASVALIGLIHKTLADPQASTMKVVGLFAGFCLVVIATQIFSRVVLTRLSQHMLSKIRLGLCRRILDSPLRRLEEIGEHRLLAVLTGDVNMIATATNGLPVILVNTMILLCGAIYMGWLSPLLLTVATVVGAAGVASYHYSARFALDYVRKGREAQDLLLQHVRTIVKGVKELKIHQERREEFLEHELTDADAEVRENQIVGFCLQGAAIAWGRLAFFLGIGLLLFAWPKIREVDGATLAGYTLTVLYLMSPLERIMAWLPLIDRASVAAGKIRRLGLQLDLEKADSGDAAATFPTFEQIELDGVSHTYRRQGDERQFQLGPVNLTFRPGEIVFIVGGNGSGKTTLAKLLTGLYVPEEGEVRVDGRPVTEETRESYRQFFSVVFDDVVLFDRLLGVEASNVDERAFSYLQLLELDHAVTVTDGVVSTTNLSRGQRKRLALLTAYLEDRPIYLFDEWAADQDPKFKDIFYRRLLPELRDRGKTVLAITHDDRYFHTADWLLKLEEGQATPEQPSGEIMNMNPQ